MEYSSLHIKTVAELRQLAREMQVKLPAGMKKENIIQTLLQADQERAAARAAEKQAAEKAQAEKAEAEKAEAEKAEAKAPEAPAKAEPVEAERAPLPAAAKEAPEPEAAPEPVDPPLAQTAPVASAEAGEEDRPRPLLRQQRPFARGAELTEPRPAPRTAGYAGSNPAYVNRRPAPLPGRAPQPRPGRTYENAPAVANRPYAPRTEAQGEAGAGYTRPEGEYRRPTAYTPEYGQTNPAVPEMLAAGDCPDGAGVLEIHPDGYGFLRAENYSAGSHDVYVSIAQIRRFSLKNGDYVVGKTRPQREGDRYNAMIYITEVNGKTPELIARRRPFESLIPVYPNERLRLEDPSGKPDLALRLIDMLAPIGKGQRGMIVSPPKAGKTTLLKKVANAITRSYPEVHVIVLLIDERPEELTDMQRSIEGEVVYSTFDEAPENHTRISEMVLERAQRLVEQGEDVVVLLDSITRLARAYNITIPPTGRSLSGGLDPGALLKPKRFFGAARNIENGGSLTIIATALVETGSRMDDIIYEEFKGTGNMELHLDRKLSDRRIFPAIDMLPSGTRRDDLLMDEAELVGSNHVRRMLAGSTSQNTAEQLIGMLEKTQNNAEFYRLLKGLKGVYEKDGYSMGGNNRTNDY